MSRALRVLVLAPSLSPPVMDLVAAARSLGIEPILGLDPARALGATWPARALRLDMGQPEAAADVVVAALGAIGLDGVVATDDDTAVLAAMIAARLRLTHARIAAIRTAASPVLLREALRAAGLPQPAGAVVPSGEDPTPAAERLGYPLVLRSLEPGARGGIARVNRRAELAGRVARLGAGAAAPVGADDAPAGALLVERIPSGSAVAVEGLLSRGVLRCLALFDRLDPPGGPGASETILVTPSHLSRREQADAITAVQRACAAIDLDHGPVSAELCVPREDPPVVLELAARSMGGPCGRALRLGPGVALEEILVAAAVGLDPGEPTRPGAVAGGALMLSPSEPGVLVEVIGADKARAIGGVRELVVTARVGEAVAPPPEGPWAGFLLATGDSREDVIASLRGAGARLRLRTRPIG